MNVVCIDNNIIYHRDVYLTIGKCYAADFSKSNTNAFCIINDDMNLEGYYKRTVLDYYQMLEMKN